MFRTAIVFLILAGALTAANQKLYLKDGTYHSVREYKTEGDRVRYFSTERGEWEEIPLSMVDLKRTESEVQTREAAVKEEAAAIDAEEKAELAERRELEKIPIETGVYFRSNDKITPLKIAESKVVNNKRRSILKAMSPIPIVAGKSTVELDGPKSSFVVHEDRPEFYMRPSAEERIAIVRLTPGKTNSRVVQTWNKIPVSQELIEEMENVDIFRKQLADGLFKIWPTKPLAAGEYAVIEYTEGKGNVQIWDFSAAPQAASPKP